MSETADEFESAVQAIAEAKVTREDVESMLRTFGQRVGGQDLNLDEHGTCRFVDSDERQVILVYRPPFPGVTLFSPVIDDEVIPRPMLIGLLSANASWESTAGGTFSMPDPGASVMFSRRIPLLGTDPNLLHKAVEEFCALTERWETELYFYLDAYEPETAEQAPTTIPPMAQV
ncbi:MAG: type III secretion system chaperone [Pseudomonadota bacterium]